MLDSLKGAPQPRRHCPHRFGSIIILLQRCMEGGTMTHSDIGGRRKCGSQWGCGGVRVEVIWIIFDPNTWQGGG